jgi:hypothetical protein
MGETKQMLFAKNLICICVDEKKNEDYLGKIYHQYSDSFIPFDGVADMMLKIEELFDEWDFPQRGLAERAFTKEAKEAIRERNKRRHQNDSDLLPIEIIQEKFGVRNIQNKKGELGTFVVQVVYRQDATWQGHVIIKEANEKMDFISAFELIKIMDKALEENQD